MSTFYSHGKLLISGEYAVLDGAKALALPTKLGQSLRVTSINNSEIHWKSFDHQGKLWFETTFQYPDFIPTNRSEIAKRLSDCFKAIAKMQPDCFEHNPGFEMVSTLEFPKNWGLGSSSTLINNLAQWAKIDAFKLLKKTFGGSGYDIACAQNSHPIVYQKQSDNPVVSGVTFDPPFKDNLYFVYRNKKQNSREAIAAYNALKNSKKNHYSEINSITDALLHTTALDEFETLITKHETIIGQLIQQPPLKSTHFPDYGGAIKSLGAWGGDFFLATGQNSDIQYFTEKGYDTIVPFEMMVL